MKTYVFPGQGSQKKTMGGTLFDEFESLTRAADSILGYSIKELCLEDPDNRLNRTEFTQPALYVVNALSYYKKLQESERPDFLAGHSLGEFNALLAAECFSFETGLRLVRKRGELMARAQEGAMAAVLNASAQEIRTILDDNGLTSIDLANFNSASQIVISGPPEDIKAAKPLFQSGKHLFAPLNTSGAFHSRYMEPARQEFSRFLDTVTFSPQKVPVISNVTARPYEDHRAKELLAGQLTGAVRWSDSVQYLLGLGEMEFKELGHGNVLTKLINKIRREAPQQPQQQPRPTAAQPPLSAEELVRQWNERNPVGTRVRSKVGEYQDLETATPATVLFGHRAAVYMIGYRGYFDLTEIESVN
ncbi:ACP S-malonyltransferase [Streptomyces sp. NEAU-W12]|uniref:ACP S-malonyltransferase n=1 Tax=Streptomyces sp. NEAU-W12 TaxID=2994668 RepID=UPI00224B3C6E|nr:ACP S-malonyltransferase [Streptomyces sp. NEAU-W12]MCX2924135.1 ACP S-malonyltransferase [Streptomyces sp. NEAU-W12]